MTHCMISLSSFTDCSLRCRGRVVFVAGRCREFKLAIVVIWYLAYCTQNADRHCRRPKMYRLRRCQSYEVRHWLAAASVVSCARFCMFMLKHFFAPSTKLSSSHTDFDALSFAGSFFFGDDHASHSAAIIRLQH